MARKPNSGTQGPGSKTYSIGDLTAEFDITPRSLRFYETRGLLSPMRSGLARIYSERDKARITLILQGKRMGFTLLEIRMMLAEAESKGLSNASFKGSLDLKKAQILNQLENLKQQRQEIDIAIVELEAALSQATETVEP